MSKESVETIRTRGEDRLGCPRCGQHGHLLRVGGGNLRSTFSCRASDYPRRFCGFRFSVTDKELSGAVGR